MPLHNRSTPLGSLDQAIRLFEGISLENIRKVAQDLRIEPLLPCPLSEEQKAARRKWHAVVEIAKAYITRGLDFPFGLFVAMDYGLEPRPDELIQGYRLSNATALAVSQHELAQEGVALLCKRGWLPIVGASGDGKTTLARGIAGRLWTEGYLVFNYQPPAIGERIPLQDVLTFIQAADRSCVLLLDDANRALSETDLTQIGAAAGRPVLVLATWTRDRLSEDPRPERHLQDWLLVNWERIRPAVKAFLLAHEAKVVAAIQQHQDRREPRRVGLGYMDVPLARHIERYEEEAKTVSEFLFLVRGGSHTVQTEIEGLADDSRSDTPVLYAAIEQIAGFEQPVTPADTARACEVVSQERRPPRPDPGVGPTGFPDPEKTRTHARSAGIVQDRPSGLGGTPDRGGTRLRPNPAGDRTSAGSEPQSSRN